MYIQSRPRGDHWVSHESITLSWLAYLLTLSQPKLRSHILFFLQCTNIVVTRGGSRGAIGAIAPCKTYEKNFIHIILYNSENNIRDIKLFYRPLFCHDSVVNTLHLSYRSEAVMSFDFQILLKSTP